MKKLHWFSHEKFEASSIKLLFLKSARWTPASIKKTMLVLRIHKSHSEQALDYRKLHRLPKNG